MLISFISTSGRFLENVNTVELSDADETFGVRRVDTGEVVVPAGTLLDNPREGLYTYDAGGLDENVVYECSIKAVGDNGTTYIRFRKYAPLSSTEDDIASSESDSSSESIDGPSRSVQLERDELELVTIEGRGDLFRLKITAVDAILMPEQIFTFQRHPPDARTGLAREDFLFVATPFDATIYPADDADPKQRPAFYRKSELELLVPSTQIADEIWTGVKAEVRGLVAAYNRLDYLTVVEEVVLYGDGTADEPFEEEAVAACESSDIAAGEEAAAIDEEIAEAVDVTMFEHGSLSS